MSFSSLGREDLAETLLHRFGDLFQPYSNILVGLDPHGAALHLLLSIT